MTDIKEKVEDVKEDVEDAVKRTVDSVKAEIEERKKDLADLYAMGESKVDFVKRWIGENKVELIVAVIMFFVGVIIGGLA